jgi:hypothetical protein
MAPVLSTGTCIGAKRRPDTILNLLSTIVIHYAEAVFVPTLVPKNEALPSELASVSKIRLQGRM